MSRRKKKKICIANSDTFHRGTSVGTVTGNLSPSTETASETEHEIRQEKSTFCHPALIFTMDPDHCSSTATASETEREMRQEKSTFCHPVLVSTMNTGYCSPTAKPSEIEHKIRNEMRTPSMTIACSSTETPMIIAGSSTETASEIAFVDSNSLRPKYKKRKPHLRRYFGDCETDDMDTPVTARQDWKIAKKTVLIQRKKISNLQQNRRRLKSRISCLNSLINHLKEKYLITESAENLIEASLPGTSGALMKRVLEGPSRQKYTPELRAFALTLSFYSTKAYNYVRDTFIKSLPHTSTLSKWYRSIDGRPGFSQEDLQAIKIKVTELAAKGHKVLCNLVMDEMAIMKRTEWTETGFVGGTNHTVDIGTNLAVDHLPQAKDVLLFMLVCINGHWKVPVGYLLINGLSGKEKANVVMKLLEFLNESGAVITSLTFDGAPTNFTMISELGAKLNDVTSLVTYFPHPVTKKIIYIFPDKCHCLKLVRNCIGDKLNFEDDEGNTMSWSFYMRLAELQSTEGLRAGTKLGSRHINWVREKMKVKLAAQLFSRSVADAFIFLKDDMKMEEFKNVEATAKFTRTMNDLFDIFNS